MHAGQLNLSMTSRVKTNEGLDTRSISNNSSSFSRNNYVNKNNGAMQPCLSDKNLNANK